MTSSPDRFVAWAPPDLLTGATRGLESPRAINPSHAGPAAPADPGAPLAPSAWAPPDLAGLGMAAVAAATTPEDEAFALGLADGLRQGEARASERLRPVLDTLHRLTAQIEASRARFEHDRASNLSGLALAVAHHVMQREMAADPSILSGLVSKALELMPANTPVEVRLHPADLAALAPELDAIAATGRPVALSWSSDATLPRGGFVLEGPQRIVDGRADSALRTLFERLDHV